MKQILPLSFRMLIGLLLVAAAAKGQNDLRLELGPKVLNVSRDSTFEISLKVSGFTNITAFKIPVTFNNGYMKLVSVKEHAVRPNFTNTSNGGDIITADIGRTIVFSWSADPVSQANGLTLADGARLFTLVFKAYKAAGASLVSIRVKPEVTQAPAATQVNAVYSTAQTFVRVGTPPDSHFGLGTKFIAHDMCIPPGEIRCMPVTVKNFEYIGFFQFDIKWNVNLLRWERIQRLHLPGISLQDFYIPNPNNGLIKVGWGSPTGSYISRVNGDTLFEICFKNIASSLDTDVIVIDGLEVYSSGGGDMTDLWSGVPAAVYLNHCPPSVSATGESPAQLPLSLGPNPFSTDTYIIFETTEAAPVRLSVADPTGRLVYERAERLPAGQHRLALAASDLRGPGLYFIHLQAGARRAARKVILIP